MRKPERVVGDVICGPRCVQYLLRYYTKPDVDIFDLVRECQWPDIEGGATLDSLARALGKRGVYTTALRTAPGAVIRWPCPVLLHMGGDGPIGHYVVWLPGSPPGTSRVWTGLDGVRTGPTSSLGRLRTGIVLLTSPGPIIDPTAAVENSVSAVTFLLWGLTATAVSLIVARKTRGMMVSTRLLPFLDHRRWLKSRDF
jgi:ABC-type bacteriocin/lantibiotic exporter with double-glycine peptidase domain